MPIVSCFNPTFYFTELRSHNGVWRTIVDVQRFILGGGGHLIVARAVAHTPHLIGVLSKGVQALAFGRVPHLDTVVTGRAGKVLTIFREGHAQHPGCVARKSTHHVRVRHIVELHVTIVRACQQHLRVG